MTVKNIKDAWEVAYMKGHAYTFTYDAKSSERAGYRIVRADEDYYVYICDLGDRLEYNDHADSYNIWIESHNDITELAHSLAETERALKQAKEDVKWLKEDKRLLIEDYDELKAKYDALEADYTKLMDAINTIKQFVA